MSSRRAQAWVLWLLPFLVARAMLPVGFMPTAGKAGMQLVLCSASALWAGDQSAPSDSAHGDLDCPFAHAHGAAPPSVFALTFAAPAAGTPTFPQPASRIAAPGPSRFDRARGPPLLS